MNKPITYALLGGGTITAASPDEIITEMRFQSMNPCATSAEFMEQTAEACRLQTGAIISTYNVEEFVADLLENGFLVKEHE